MMNCKILLGYNVLDNNSPPEVIRVNPPLIHKPLMYIGYYYWFINCIQIHVHFCWLLIFN